MQKDSEVVRFFQEDNIENLKGRYRGLCGLGFRVQGLGFRDDDHDDGDDGQVKLHLLASDCGATQPTQQLRYHP